MLKQARSSLNLIFWSSLLPVLELFAFAITMVLDIRANTGPLFNLFQIGCSALYLYGLYGLYRLHLSAVYTKNIRWSFSLSVIDLLFAFIALSVSRFQSTDLFGLGAFGTIYSLIIIYGVVLLCRAIQELCQADTRYSFLYQSWKRVEAMYIWGQIIPILCLLFAQVITEALTGYSIEEMEPFWMIYSTLTLIAYLLPWFVFLLVLKKTLTEISDDGNDGILDDQMLS